MALVYSLTRQQRSAKCDIINRCAINKVAKVYECFRGTKYQGMLKQSCFGNLVHLNELAANQIIHQLIMRLAMPWSGDAEVFWFKVGCKKIRFSKQEFCLISGFLVGNENQVDKSAGCETRLFKKYFPKKNSVDRVKLWKKFGSMKNSLDRYKLGLIVIVMYVVWASEERRAVEFWLFELVDNLDAFNKYPWGNESYKMTTRILRRNLKDTLTGDGKLSYTLHGFPHFLKVFALEIIPCVRSISEIVDANALPRMLKWGPAKRVLNCSVELLLGTKEVEAIRVLVPTEAEKVEPYCYMVPEEVNDTVNEDSDVEETVGSEILDNLVIRTARIVKENKQLFSELDQLRRRVDLLEGLEGDDGNVNEDPNVEVEDPVDAEIVEKLVRTAGRVEKENEGMFAELNIIKRRVELLEGHEDETLEEEVGKETETVVESEKEPVKVKGPATRSKVAKKKRVEVNNNADEEMTVEVNNDADVEVTEETNNNDPDVDMRVEEKNNADAMNEVHDVPLEPAVKIYSRLKRMRRLSDVSFNARVTRSKAIKTDQVVGDEKKKEVVEIEKKDEIEIKNKEVVEKVKEVVASILMVDDARVTRSKAIKKDQLIHSLLVENETEKVEKEKEVVEPEEESVAKKMEMDATYDFFEDLSIPLVNGGISLESAPERYLINLRYHHAYAEVLRNILEGASLSDQILNDGLCELRRRCKAYPNIFDQDAVVLDSNFILFVTKLYDSKVKQRILEDIKFTNVFKNYVSGKTPEDSRPFAGCKTLYLHVLKDSHWFLLKIDLIERNVYVYDSLRGHIRQNQLSKLLLPICLIIPHLFKKHVEGFENYSVEKLEVVVVRKCPSQENGDDCGMFVFKFIEFMLAKMDVDLIKSKDMLKWRKRFVAELVPLDNKEIC